MATNVIYKTKDYTKFKIYKFNRTLNESLVKRLMESIKKLGYIAGKSVIVDTKFNIVDGQHRFEACKRLDLPIFYTVSNVDAQEAMIALNAHQVVWSAGDYIHTWAEAGVTAYKKLLEFQAKHGCSTNSATCILFDVESHHKPSDKIKEGFDFPLNPKAEDIMLFIDAAKSVPYWKNAYFQRSVVRLFKIANSKQIKKIQENIISLPQQATSAAYIVAFENIVNRGVQSKNRISFKDKQ